MDGKGEPRRIVVSEDPDAPFIFFDDAGQIIVKDGVVRLNLTRVASASGREHGEESIPLIQTVAAKIAMPVTTFARLVEFLSYQYEEGVKDGVYPRYDRLTGEYSSGQKSEDDIG